MEWVETTGKTVEDAKEAALDQLGVHEDDAEIEVIEEPRAGLFGRMRGEARVRARVRPTRPRAKTERRDRRRRRPEGARRTETARGQAYEVFSVRAAIDHTERVYANVLAGKPAAEGVADTAVVA